MNKTFTLFALFMLIAGACMALAGSGTSGDPYRITTCDELQMMELYPGAYWKLMNDIDCAPTQTGTGQWTSTGFRSVGDTLAPFTGNFNGNCFSVENLFINDPSSNYTGLFGYTNNATVRSVKMLNVNIKGNNYTGGLIGKKLSSTVDDIYVSGSVTGQNYTGGVIGKSDNYQGTPAALTNAYSQTTVTGYNYTGGVVGYLTTFQGGASYIDYCWSTGNVTGNHYTGGVAGACGTYQGGGAELNYCHSTGNVSGVNQVGGLVGDMGPIMGGGSSIIRSYATGNVMGTSNVGGLAGRNGPNSGGASEVHDSYARGNVTGNSNVGGLIGTQTSTGVGWGIDTCYCTGLVTGTTNKGGFVGNQTNTAVFTLDFWNVTINPTLQSIGNMGSNPNIMPSTTAQMQNQVTYTNWNFVSVWSITSNNYPKLVPASNITTCNTPNTLTAAFNNSPVSVCFGDTVQFTDVSLGTPTSWSWNFGDPASGPNNTSILQNPQHFFTTAGTYYVQFVAMIGNNTDTIVTPVVVTNCTTGMPTLHAEQGLQVYPNPSTGAFIVEGVGELCIYNVVGELILTQHTDQNKTQMDLSSLPSGIYIIQLKNSQGISQGKIIKE